MLTKVHRVKAMVFPVVMCGCGNWTIKKAECWRIDAFELVLKKTLACPLNIKETKLINPKGNQSFIFIGRTDAEAEASILWPADANNWLIRKDPDAGKDWRQEEKGTTEDDERWLLNHANTPGFLAPGGEEFNPGPETRLDRSELLCNKVLLKYKGNRESFWHRHQKGAEKSTPLLVLTMRLYNPKTVWRLQRPHQTHSHNLHLKVTLSSGKMHPCKDRVYSHN